jgi:hypothetical protein
MPVMSVARKFEEEIAEHDLPSVIWVTPEEGKKMLDEAVRDRMGISGEEFIRRWDAGEYDSVADQPGHLIVGYLGSLIPFAREDN